MSSDLSGRYWNEMFKEGKTFYREVYDDAKEDLLADGYPPFHVPLSPAERFQKLVAQSRANDLAFTNDPKAQRDLARLSQQFAPQPAALPAGTYPTTIPLLGGP